MLRLVRPSPLLTKQPSSSVQVLPTGNEPIPQTTSSLVGGQLLKPETKFEPVPTGYKFLSPSETAKNVSSTLTTRFLNLPNFLGGGQLATDVTQPGKIIKSDRDLTSKEKSLLRSGRSSSGVEVEHILPLWAGGTNQLTNIQLLNPEVHEKKTLVDAALRSLYYAQELSLNDARTIAYDWQNKNVDGIIQNAKGDVPLEIAREKLAEWRGVPKVTAGNYLSSLWGNVKKLPELVEAVTGGTATAGAAAIADVFAPGNKYDAIAEGMKYAKKVLAGKEGFTSSSLGGEFLKGTIEGATGNYIQKERPTFESPAEQGIANISRTSGHIAGTLLNYMALKSVVTKVAGATKLTNLLGKTRVGQILTSPTGQVVKDIPVKMNKIGRILGDTGMFGLQSALSRGETNDFNSRVKRFLEGAAYGSVLGGAGTLKGWKSYGATSLGAYTLGRALGDSEEDSLVNAAIITGLHGLSRFGSTKATREKMIQVVATRESENFFRKYNVEPPTSTVGSSNMAKALTDVKDSIISKFKDGKISEAEVDQELKNSFVFAKQIYRNSLGREAKLREEVKDLKSLFGRKKQVAGEVKVTTPEIGIESDLQKFKENFPEQTNAPKSLGLDKNNKAIYESPQLVAEKIRKSELGLPVTAEEINAFKDAPAGRMQLTGTADVINPQTAANLIAYDKLLRSGQPVVSRRVWGVFDNSPSMTSKMKEVNSRMMQENPVDISEGRMKPYERPELNIRYFTFVNGEPYELGAHPRRFRIDHPETGINASVDRYNKLPDISAPREKFDSNFEKDVLGDYLISKNIKMFPATVVETGRSRMPDITKPGGKVNEPYIIIEVTPKDFAEAVRRRDTLERKTTLKTIEKVETEQKKIAAQTASGVLDAKKSDSAAKDIVANSFRELEEPLKKGDWKTFRQTADEIFGPIVDDKMLSKYKDNPKLLTPGEIAIWLENGKQTGQLNPTGQTLYNFMDQLVLSDTAGINDAFWKTPLVRKIGSATPTAPKVEEIPEPLAQEAKQIVENNGTTKKFGEFNSVVIKKVPESEIRNQGIGDYKKTKKGGIEILVSNELPETEAKQVAMHELVESNLAEQRGISFREIDKFDRDHITSEEPGALKNAPYHKEHLIANKAEKLIETPGAKTAKVVEAQVKTQKLPLPTPAESKEISKEIAERTSAPPTDDVKTREIASDNQELAKTIQSEQAPEVVFASDQPKPRDFDKYGGDNKVNVGADKILLAEELRLEQAGKLPEAAEIRKFREKLTRPIMEAKAKLLLKENNGDINKAFDQFQEALGKNGFERFGLANPFNNKKNSQVLRHHFLRLAEGNKRRVFTIDSNGKFSIRESDPQANSKMYYKIEKYNQKNGTDIDVIYFDPGTSTLDRKMRPDQKEKYIADILKRNGYVLLGPSGNKFNTITAIKFDKKLVDKFDEKPNDYLAESETAPATDYDKFIRVFFHDVMGFPKELYLTDVLKRAKIFNSPQSKNSVRGKTYTYYIIKSPTVGEIGVIDINRLEPNAPKELVDKFLDKAQIDGKIFMSQAAMNEISEAQGSIYKQKRLKPTVAYSYIDKNGNNQIFMQKGDIITYDGPWRKIFEEKLGRHLGKYDVVTFNDNIKKGLDAIPSVESPSGAYRTLDVPSEEHHFEYNSIPKEKASIAASFWGKFSNKDKIGDELKNLYSPQTQKWSEFNQKLNESKGAEDVQKLFQEYFGIDFGRGLYDRYQKMFDLGAGKISLNKQLDDEIKNIFQERVINTGFADGVHLYLAPDLGYIKDGQRVYLKPGEVMISRKAWPYGSEAATLRFPVTHRLAVGKNKVLFAEDYGINNLGREHVIISQHDVYINKAGDYDGDQIHLIPISNQKGFPEKVANLIEEERQKLGEVVVGAEFSKYGKMPPTQENLIKIGGDILLGEEAVNISSTTSRIMQTLIDNKMKITVSGSTGKNARNFQVKFGDYVYRKGTIAADGKKYEPTDIEPTWNRDNEKLNILVQNAATDATTSSALAEMGWDPDMLVRTYFKTKDPKIIKIVNQTISPLGRAKAKSTGHIQDFLSLSQKGSKIGFQQGKSSVESLVDELNAHNRLIDQIRNGGGNLSPVQELATVFKNLTPFKKPSAKVVVDSDLQAGREIVKEIGTKIKITAKAQKFIKFGEEKQREYSKAFLDYPKEQVAEKRSSIRQEVIDEYNKNFRSFDQADLDAISYWSITSPNSDFAKPFSNKVFPKGVYRFDEFFTPEQGRLYYKVRESFPY